MHRKDKKRIKLYQDVLSKLGEAEIPGEAVKTKKGLLRKKTVAVHFDFDDIDEARTAKKQAAELKREANLYRTKIRADMKEIRRIYREAIGRVGSGAGLTGAILGSKQKIIQAKAKQKRQLATERDTRVKDYERVLRQFDNIVYVFDSIRSGADAYIAENTEP